MEYALAHPNACFEDDNNNNNNSGDGGSSASSQSPLNFNVGDASSLSSLSRVVHDLVINGCNDEVTGKCQPSHHKTHHDHLDHKCHGKRQSPIDIETHLAEKDSELCTLSLCYSREDQARLVNDGKTPACYVMPGRHFLSGGPLSEQYELVQYHIHFAGQNGHGSEHTIDGRGYPAEIHFVHYKSSYGDFSSALSHPDGLAVVGAFVDVDNNNAVVHEQLNSDVMKMINIIEKAGLLALLYAASWYVHGRARGRDAHRSTTFTGSTHSTSVELEKYDVAKSEHFYHYSGSLTSAPYQECVEWILMREPISISTEAFEVLKKLHASHGETMFEHGNSRSTQDRSSRQILCNFTN